MAYLYLTESDLKLGCTDGQVVIKRLDGEKVREVPFHAVDGNPIRQKRQIYLTDIHLKQENCKVCYIL